VRRFARWLGLSVLVIGAVAGAGFAWRNEAEVVVADDPSSAAPAVSTPVLSVRRTPALVASPIADRELMAELQGLAERLPEESCLTVAGPGISFGHRSDAPMIPASAQKLLTATAAIEVLGSGPTVLERVERILRDSDDATAEALFEEIGRAAVVTEVLADVGVLSVADGTGHSRENLVTCQMLVDLLLRAETGGLIGERLAVAGETGTLQARFVGTDLVGILRAKTGSLTSVLALAGVVEDADPPLTFAMVVNTTPGTPVPAGVEALQRDLGEALARWPAGPDASVVGPEGGDG
jgi:hypothetical protein